MKITVRGGHNPSATGASSNIMDELTEDRKVKDSVIKYLKQLGQDVLDVTPGNCDVNTDLSYGVNKANSWGADLFISIHFNKAYDSYNGALGSEVWIYGTGGNAQPIAGRIVNKLASDVGFVNRGTKVSTKLYELRNTIMSACIIEVCFVEATKDVELYRAKGYDFIGKCIAEAIVNQSVSSQPTSQPVQPQTTTKHPIMGKADLTKEQIVKYILDNNPTPQIPVPIDEFVSYYFEEGVIEGVRPDFAACQSILETGFFKFGNDVKPEQNNFAGIGSTANGVNGASFPDARTGIRAQLQHLKAYASTESLKQTCVDPRYNLITTKGFAPNVEDLSSKWSVQSDYGQKIIAIYEKIKSIKVDSNPIPTIRYQAQVENIGWQGWVKNGETAGTEAKGLRLEALAIDYQGSGSISVEGCIQNLGWQAIRHSGEIVGTVGEALRLEGIKINLDDKNYLVQYQVHVQDIGWMPWVSDGEVAGTVGQSKRIEAIRIKIAKK